MSKISQKIFPAEELREKVTIRVLPEKAQVYPRFKELATKILGSDVCFITTSLWEAFILAMDQVPPADDQLEIKFLRQNVQVNIGCNIIYQPKKARRTPGTVLPKIEMKKNLFMPLVLDEWKTLDEKQKQQLRNLLIQEGIIEPPKPRKKRAPPSASSGKLENRKRSWRKSMVLSMTIVSNRIRRRIRKLFGRK